MPNYWYYRKQQGDAGLNRKPPRLKDLGEHSIRIFVREVLQNNLDAVYDGRPITVEIKIQEWKKNEIEAFFHFLGDEHIALLKKSAINPDPSIAPFLKNCIDILSGKKSSTYVVVVEETNCIGLLGPVRETKQEKSHFDALMRKVENNEAKKETTNTGGTWGKGSSIFTYTSLIWTWFSYTKLSKPWYDSEKAIEHEKRFIGRCMIAPFFDEETSESFLGDGWFCDKDKLNSSLKSERIDAYPFINAEADAFAQKLGLQVRNEPGTTFFIPFFNPQLENAKDEINLEIVQKEFVEQVLRNWFIPVYNNDLTVKIVTNFQTFAIDQKYLSAVPELKFKLQLLDWCKKDFPPDDNRFMRKILPIEVPALKDEFLNERTRFAAERNTCKADLLIRVLDEDEDFTDTWKTINTVALARNKGMIISDKEFVKNNSLRTEAILLAGILSKSDSQTDRKRQLDLFLAYSENPAHNKWCDHKDEYSECFLDRFKGLNPRPEFSINRLFNDIIGVYKKLLEDDTEHKENKDICSIFKKLAKLKSRGDDGGGKSIFHMRTIGDEIDLEGRYIFTRRIISACNSNDILVSFKSYIDSLEGDKDKEFELLGVREFGNIQILNSEGKLVSEGITPTVQVSPNEEIILKIRTCKIDGNPYFKNLEPFIRTNAEIISNE